VSKGFTAEVKLERIAIVGFSQAACLTSEIFASQPRRYGALVAFTGDLIGPMGMDLRHPGQLDGMPVLLSSGDPDPHVRWERVRVTREVLTAMGMVVQTARYANRPHTILNEEIVAARDL
jgi:predicted esterase